MNGTRGTGDAGHVFPPAGHGDDALVLERAKHLLGLGLDRIARSLVAQRPYAPRVQLARVCKKFIIK
jgi:hypothetical protein